MIAVKIECDCGQHYAFDVEPVNGRMGTSVACPACGADGTAAADDIIAQKVAPTPPPISPIAPAIAPVATGSLRINKSEASPVAEAPKITASDRELGIVSREQAQAEARAKVSWGDSQENVIKYLMLQRFTVPEARELVAVMFKERMVTVRANGVRKIIAGIGLMFVPVIAYGFFRHLGIIPLKLMAMAVMVGLWGVWQLLNGIIALVAPKLESGDVADQ